MWCKVAAFGRSRDEDFRVASALLSEPWQMSGYHRHVDCKWQSSRPEKKGGKPDPCRSDKLVMVVPLKCTRCRTAHADERTLSCALREAVNRVIESATHKEKTCLSTSESTAMFWTQSTLDMRCMAMWIFQQSFTFPWPHFWHRIRLNYSVFLSPSSNDMVLYAKAVRAPLRQPRDCRIGAAVPAGGASIHQGH